MEKSKYTSKKCIKDYWFFLKGRRTDFVLSSILIAISNLFPFAVVFLLGKIIDFFTLFREGDPLTPFYWYVVGMAFFGAFQVWLRFLGKIRISTMAAQIRKEVRVNAMTKLMDLDLKWHEKEETGSKIQKINEGGQNIFQAFQDFSNQGIYIITTIIGSFLLFLSLRWQYALYSAIYLLIYFIGEAYFNRKISYLRDELNKIKEKVSGKIHESASNILTVKSLGLKTSMRKKSTSYENKFYNMWVKTRTVNLPVADFATIKRWK